MKADHQQVLLMGNIPTSMRLENSGGFDRLDVLRIFKIIEENRDKLLESWNECFID